MIKSRRPKRLSHPSRRRERRTKIDPRYRNPNYPNFKDRRREWDRREPERVKKPPLFGEHGSRRRHTWMAGALAAILLIFFLSLALICVRNFPSITCREPKKSVSPIVSF